MKRVFVKDREIPDAGGGKGQQFPNLNVFTGKGSPVLESIDSRTNMRRAWMEFGHECQYSLEQRAYSTQKHFMHLHAAQYDCTLAKTGKSGMRAVIEGPYNKEIDLKSHDTVLLFATGIGNRRPASLCHAVSRRVS
jgi:hypothetical protein